MYKLVKKTSGIWFSTLFVFLFVLFFSYPTDAAKFRIMPLGDSISKAYNTAASWRYYLTKLLGSNGFTDIDFVGPSTGTQNDAGSGWDSDNACFWGWAAYMILNESNNVKLWAPKYKPNIAIIHLGTNDIRHGQTTAQAIGSIKSIIDVLRATDPTVKIVVAIIPDWEGYSFDAGKVAAFNAEIAKLPSTYSTATSPIKTVDLHSDWNIAVDDRDNIHPSSTGAPIIANRIFPVLKTFLTPSEPMLTSISISPGSVVLTNGESKSFTATPKDQSGNNFSADVTWSLSGVGKISSTSGLTVKYTAPASDLGKAVLVAKSGNVEKSISIEVLDPKSIHIMVNSGGSTIDNWVSGSKYLVSEKTGESYNFGQTPDISNMTNPAPVSIYQTCQHLDHSYSFLIPNGNYTVRIHLYDPTGDTKRKMNYTIEGKKVLSDFMPTGTAVIKDFNVTVSDNNGLQIAADKGSGNDVFEVGIEILGSGQTPIVYHKTNNIRMTSNLVRTTGRTLTFLPKNRNGMQVSIFSPNGTRIAMFSAKNGTKWIAPSKGVYVVNISMNHGSTKLKTLHVIP